MSKIQEELKHTLQLLKKEWAADLQQYQNKIQSTSLADRKKEGVCWYPVELKKKKFGFGERMIVEVERMDDQGSHGFQSGKSVSLFSNAREGKYYRANGVVNFVRKNIMVITLSGGGWPEWLHDGKLGVDLLFDEASYREMEFALHAVMKSSEGRLGYLRDVMLGDLVAGKSSWVPVNLPALNTSQGQAVNGVMEAQDLGVIHGPPGTGKTTTLVAAVQLALEYHDQVLVCAPSNAAVDLLVEKLINEGVSTLRIGHPARVDDQILSQTLDAKIAQHGSYKELKKLRKSAEEFKRLGKKYKRKFGPEERAQRKKLMSEASRVKEEADHLENYILYDVFQQSKVVATTLVGASNTALKGIQFPVVFIDEAAQGMEPATWIPILKGERIIMAGDHCQLPPTIKSFEAAKEGLSETLFEKAIKRQKEMSWMLTLQYRMPKMIMAFSNEYFYKGELEAAPNTEHHYLATEEPVMEFIDTAGSGFGEQIEKDSLSKLNMEEGRFSLAVLDQLIKRVGMDGFRENPYNVGIISPYKAQVKQLNEMVEDGDFPMVKKLDDLLTIDTVDGFQGQERDLILISLVRSNDKGEIGFLADTRRMNVALTRAKRKLIVVGDSATLGNHPFYKAFLNYAERNNIYRSVYEYLEF
ncbi:AAA domain-containing protein [Echinicola jeungdonensis]|uniref:DNA helicase n=1 Tax=Echinicola jeungdonensis TaxID=709343 RepID=A0ABV5J7W6_9BACT|nr:AAA domain-containing protein [Echinicola jeungdonensis]MDN3670021.1 AAA domain-containing protein [Echinicola jeungdonensis]